MASLRLKDRKVDTDPVLSSDIANSLRLQLPSRYRLSSEWTLLYSLDQHGISMSTLYRLVKGNKGPIVLAVKDADDNIFGAFLNETLKSGPRYYGTGECFLWKWSATESKTKAFHWTGKNEYMILSEPDFLAIGGGDGVFGLWINSELEKGYSQPCPTFDNEGLTPAPEFECVELEVWGFRI
ncbi:TLD-domain-containing protein [Backusella circina FSU 941]|nr:TLD-domain-containing protein [Backusella circina FSU 941]